MSSNEPSNATAAAKKEHACKQNRDQVSTRSEGSKRAEEENALR